MDVGGFNRIIVGDCLSVLPTLPASTLHCCVTSPPYWRLRDYGVAGQLGLEATPDEYVARMVAVFREVRRVLRDDGTCFVNLGDSYASSAKGHALACGICGRELADCPSHDSTLIHLCDACQADLFRRTLHNGSRPAFSLVDDSHVPNQGHKESVLGHLPMKDCEDRKELPRSSGAMRGHSPSVDHVSEQLLASPKSTQPESSSAFSDHASIPFREEAAPVGDPTSASCAPQSEHMDSCTPGREAMLFSFASRILGTDHNADHVCPYPHYIIASLKSKDLVGIPWRVAFALQSDGWWLRSDIIWAKPNPMPESVQDRPTRSHENLFLLTKRYTYYYNADAIREPQKTLGERHEGKSGYRDGHPSKGGMTKRELHPLGANKRDVWTIPTQPYKGAHFATFPEKLVEPCILAGCPEGGVVLDPFMGSGTVGRVAERLGRRWLGVELSEKYAELARGRTRQAGLALYDEETA